MQIIILHKKWVAWWLKTLFPSLGFKDQSSQMTWVVVKGGKLTEYCLPT